MVFVLNMEQHLADIDEFFHGVHLGGLLSFASQSLPSEQYQTWFNPERRCHRLSLNDGRAEKARTNRAQSVEQAGAWC